MSAPLRRVVVCAPEAAGWNDRRRAGRWRELGYLHEPDFETAAAQHAALCEALEGAGATIERLPGGEDLGLDAVYAHDASLVTDAGAILMRMGKRGRRGEPAAHEKLYRALGIPILGAIEPPGTVEAGDLVWLGDETLLAGRGYRTNDAGIRQLAALLEPLGVEVIPSVLPHGPGPDGCLHLMSLMSVLDERVALVDLAWLSVPTVELLHDLDFRLVEIHPAERGSMAVNVLALGERRLLALEENVATNERLRSAGFEVLTFPGGEICQNGSGGPTCLTRPVLREKAG